MIHFSAARAGAAALATLFTSCAAAQSYPVKPIRIVVGYAPGGAVDFTARLVAQKLPEHVRQSVIVENRPGAGSTIGTERVASAPPDGYTLLLMPTTAVVQSALRTNLSYNLERDLQPVSLVASGPFVLVVHPSVPARNVKELIALARSRPGQLNCASPGIGSANHLAQELINTMANVKLAHVPYKGGNEAAVATASGHVDLSFPSVAGALPLIQAKRVRAIAVSGLKRTPLLPELPTLDEAGVPGYDYTAWYGIVAPAGVAKDIIARLNAANRQRPGRERDAGETGFRRAREHTRAVRGDDQGRSCEEREARKARESSGGVKSCSCFDRLNTNGFKFLRTEGDSANIISFYDALANVRREH
jgi:tripartite-type tricarboxylate transporter receptor subunit TctC